MTKELRWSNSKHADPDSFSEVFFTTLTGTELTIVLDDYHHILVDSAVHQFLIPGLERLGTGRWLVASPHRTARAVNASGGQ